MLHHLAFWIHLACYNTNIKSFAKVFTCIYSGYVLFPDINAFIGPKHFSERIFKAF